MGIHTRPESYILRSWDQEHGSLVPGAMLLTMGCIDPRHNQRDRRAGQQTAVSIDREGAMPRGVREEGTIQEPLSLRRS